MNKKVTCEVSQKMFSRSKKIVPGGVHSPVRAYQTVGGEPIFFQSAQGAYVETVGGKKLIDFCQSFGPNILGHRDSDVENEVVDMIKTAWSFGACEPYSLELAEWITERIPWAESLRFVNSGTEAVMSALRLARAFTSREKIVKFDGCYHGHVDNMLVKAGSGLAGESSSSSAGVSENIADNTLVVSLDDREALEKVFADYGDQIAAVIIEPLPANYGLLQQDQGFLELIAEKTKANKSLLIFDEVISGFRVDLKGMSHLVNIKPDLVTYGKVIGGGFPVGCYAGRKDIMDMMAPVGPVYQAGTLSANPVSMRAGLATLKKAERENVHSVLSKRTANFASELTGVFKNSDLAVTSFNSLFWIHPKAASGVRSIANLPGNLADGYADLFHGLLEEGIYLAPNGYEVGFLSYAHTPEILDQTIESFKKVCN